MTYLSFEWNKAGYPSTLCLITPLGLPTYSTIHFQLEKKYGRILFGKRVY